MNGNSLLGRVLLISYIVCAPFFSQAQLCTGSLGDPTIQITFGPNGNNGAGFIPPGYTYVSSSCPNDGFYTITSSTSGCFGNAWHTVSSDHTGNGNFMLVNASNEPADFFVARLNDLCPSTTYEFSAWLMNVLLSPSGIKPNITFTIETPSGTILNQFSTGDISVTAQPEWKQYGFFFTTTAGVPDIVLRMRNNAPGGIGNDIALDDISFRPCGPTVTSVNTTGPAIINICEGNTTSYNFDGTVSTGFVQPIYQWQLSTDSGKVWTDIPNATSLQFIRTRTNAGHYWYRLTVAEAGNNAFTSCRIASNILEINVHAKPVISAGPDRVVVRGRTTTINATATGENISFSWSPPDYLSSTTALNPLVNPERDISYVLSAMSAFGCTNEDRVNIQIVEGIFVPTAFTPNNDGKNDHWTIPYLDPQLGATVSVFNRWGQLVYQVAAAETNWDGRFSGTPQPAGVYVYYIQFKDGTPGMKGTLNLIR